MTTFRQLMDAIHKNIALLAPQDTKWLISWARTDLNSINLYTLMPNKYVDIKDKFRGFSWKQNKESVHLPPGDQINSIFPHS
jgi:hypothetical protein